MWHHDPLHCYAVFSANRKKKPKAKKAKVSESLMSLPAVGTGQCLNRGRTGPKAAPYRPTGSWRAINRQNRYQLSSKRRQRQTWCSSSFIFASPFAPLHLHFHHHLHRRQSFPNPDFIQAAPPHRLASSTARQTLIPSYTPFLNSVSGRPLCRLLYFSHLQQLQTSFDLLLS